MTLIKVIVFIIIIIIIIIICYNINDLRNGKSSEYHFFSFFSHLVSHSFLVNATPVSKSKSVARANSLHHGILLREGTSVYQNIEDMVQGELVDRTIMKKGWEPAALYVLGDKARLRVSTQKLFMTECENHIAI